MNYMTYFSACVLTASRNTVIKGLKDELNDERTLFLRVTNGMKEFIDSYSSLVGLVFEGNHEYVESNYYYHIIKNISGLEKILCDTSLKYSKFLISASVGMVALVINLLFGTPMYVLICSCLGLSVGAWVLSAWLLRDDGSIVEEMLAALKEAKREFKKELCDPAKKTEINQYIANFNKDLMESRCVLRG